MAIVPFEAFVDNSRGGRLLLRDTCKAPQLHASRWICRSVWQQSVALFNEKKRSEETQTLRAGCSKAEPKIFAPLFPGARDGQNLISWRWSLPLPINPVWWGSMRAICNYRGNRPTYTSSSSSGACQRRSRFHECLPSCFVLSTPLSCRQTQTSAVDRSR